MTWPTAVTRVTGGEVIPVVVVSAARNPDLPDASHGIRRYLPKPFDLEELARTVAQLSSDQPARAVVAGG